MDERAFKDTRLCSTYTNITMPDSFEFSYWGEDPLTIQTGEFSISANNIITLSRITVVGDGVDSPVLSGKTVSLSQCNVIATGKNGIGGTAVHGESVITTNSTITANGENAIGVDCQTMSGSKGSVEVNGDNSTALRISSPDTSNEGIGAFTFFTINASGRNAVSVDAVGTTQGFTFSECYIEPSVDFGTTSRLEPQDNWNSLSLLASPSENYQLPDFVTVYFKGSPFFVDAKLNWEGNLPDFTIPAKHELTATVTSCEAKVLVGLQYHLTVQIGNDLPPILNMPATTYTSDGQLSKLSFPVSANHIGAGEKTKLCYSADNGITWNVSTVAGWQTFDLDVSGFNRNKPYLLMLESNQDSAMNGSSSIWELTINNDETYSLIETNLPPPNSTPSHPTVSSWQELLSLAADDSRKETTYSVNSDLIVDSYIDLQSHWNTLNLDMGEHSITVKDGGWLILGVNELRGLGTDKPLITVESGGSLVLGYNSFHAYSIGITNVVASGSGNVGGVAVEVQDGGNFSVVNHPNITANGTNAVAVRSLTPQPFSLPSGVSLSVQGEDATALVTAGDVDLFYCNVIAIGDGAQAVQAPTNAPIIIESANVSPLPQGADHRTGTFIGFNQDVEQPQNIWLGAAHGMYLSDTPVLATIARNGNINDTVAIWVNCVWDTTTVDFTKVGNYRSAGRFSPLLSVGINGLPVEKTVDVSIKKSQGIPDISITYPLPPISLGGDTVNYGFYIVPNATYTDDISTLWCSTDDGDTWAEADTLLDVFWPQFTAGSDNYIYINGLAPDKPYLFKLESVGRSGETDGPYAGAGISSTREVTVSSDGNVVNLDWSGDRDGGDIGGNDGNISDNDKPTDDKNDSSTPTPPTPPANTTPSLPDTTLTDSAPTTPPISFEPALPPDTATQDNAVTAPIVSEPAKAPAATFTEESGETYSRLSGAQLHKMAVGGEVQFAKQGVTVILSAQAINALSVADDSIFSIEILRQSDNDFAFAVSVDDLEITELANTKVTLPYAASAETAVIELKSANLKPVIGRYNHKRQIASFAVDSTGSFIIEEIISTDATASKPLGFTETPVAKPQAPKQPATMPLVFCGVLLLTLGMGAFLWKRKQ